MGVAGPDVAGRVLATVDAMVPAMIADIGDLVRIPSVGGTDAECGAVESMAIRFDTAGLEVDAQDDPEDSPAEVVAGEPACRREQAWRPVHLGFCTEFGAPVLSQSSASRP